MKRTDGHKLFCLQGFEIVVRKANAFLKGYGRLKTAIGDDLLGRESLERSHNARIGDIPEFCGGRGLKFAKNLLNELTERLRGTAADYVALVGLALLAKKAEGFCHIGYINEIVVLSSRSKFQGFAMNDLPDRRVQEPR